MTSDKENIYITTPLYYVNDSPHLGTAYTTVIADILNRYHRLFGRETFFLTGTDEHGQKVEQSAKRAKLSPEEHCKKMRNRFKKAWEALNIKYTPLSSTGFFYTSHRYDEEDKPDHTQVVQEVLQKLKDQGDIYPAHYKGWYCVSEEIFYTKKDLVEGKSPSGREVIPLEEKAWFFKMSKYQEPLKKHLESHPDFIYPPYRQNEIKGFLKQPLQDLCVSRPKKRVSWGVELPFDDSCVVYVWVDALLNYITGVGYGGSADEDKFDFEKWWRQAGATHLIGKDILMTHAVYWPCLLMALGLPLPKKILAHGWLLNRSSEKMSKSKGDKLDPLELTKILGTDGLRWFLAKEVILGKDAQVSKSLMIKRVNEELADNLGNIFSRLSGLLEKHFEGLVPSPPARQDLGALPDQVEKVCAVFKRQIDNFELAQALSALSRLLSEVNRHLEQSAPWKTVKTDKRRAGFAIYSSLETLRICAILFWPVMPEKMEQLLLELGVLSERGERPDFNNIGWGSFAFKKPLRRQAPLFPKIEE